MTFRIERHGATHFGSEFAGLQGRKINVSTGTRMFAEDGKRLVGKRQPPLNVEPIADEIVALIVEMKPDDRLKWYGDSKVRIIMGKVLPEKSLSKQTIDGRRKRLRKAIEGRLNQHRWRKTYVNTFEKIEEK